MRVSVRISLAEQFERFTEHWRPKLIAAPNGQAVKLVKALGEFPWHVHANEDEFFLVHKGRFRVEFRDHVVDLKPGECVLVERGTEHRTCADAEAEVLFFEPLGVLNTGDISDDVFTAPIDVDLGSIDQQASSKGE